jgi:hypothetical protein
MPIVSPFSQFRQNFKKGTDREFVRGRYVDYLLAIAARDPSYRWAAPYEFTVAVEVRREESAFAHGKEFKKIVLRFAKLEGEEFWGW